MSVEQRTRTVPAEAVADVVAEHCDQRRPVLAALEREAGHLATWAGTLAVRLCAGGRLLVAGNGG